MTGSLNHPDTDVLSRDIPTAIADAILEHETWLAAWQRAALCGLPHHEEATIGSSYDACRFGRWYAHNGGAGLLEGKLFSDLGRMHRELHEAASYLMNKVKAGGLLPADEYDAMLDVADKFRKIAVRIQELHGHPDEGTVADNDDLAEMQSRLNMLSELEREWERAARSGRPACLILVRPNGLKQVAETYGQIGIDRIFVSLAARLFAHLRPYDSVFRYGRTGFLICVPDSDATRADIVASRLDQLVSNDSVMLSDEIEIPVSARFGIALSSSKNSVQEVLDRAQRATNMAGSAEGERIVAWSPELEN
jgi:diguanylate cyclase (GGDEF)-like protein